MIQTTRQVVSLLFLVLLTPTSLFGATINAASCSSSAVQAAISTASDGDTVIIPAGSCSWTAGMSFGKGIHLSGVSKGAVTITYNAGTSATLLSVTENPGRGIEISNLRFIIGSGAAEAWDGAFINVGGSGKPVLLHDNYFDLKNRRGMRWASNKGVIWNNEFVDSDHGPTANAIVFANLNLQNWSTPDTMGMRDTIGESNVYVENNIFKGVTTQALDPDSNSRVVIRYNTFDNSGMASHGADTSEYGTRHWEVYNNTFTFTNFGDCSGAQTLPVGWYFYIRGGTGIIADNQWDDLNSCAWGNVSEINMTVQNIRRSGGPYPCQTAYPAPRQVGQSHNGVNYITDPVYIWGNTGTGNSNPGLSDYSPNECGSGAPSVNQFIQSGRDFIVGTPKPGYAKYTYPHPLRTGTTLPTTTTTTTTTRSTTTSSNSTTTTLSTGGAPPPLPQGDNGIAALFPNDVNLQSHADVIYADNFESYSSFSGLTAAGRWNEAYHAANTRIATEAGNFYHGAKGLEFTVPQTNNEVSNTVIKYLNPNRDIVFMRFYAKYDNAFNVAGSSHNGASFSASYWEGPGSGPGIRADGFNKFYVGVEAGRESSGPANPGSLNVYIYHPEQRDIWGDHFYPTGRVVPFDATPGNFGPYFVSRPEIIPQLGRWYAYEAMIKANTPSQRDGRIAIWLDGNLIADFQNIRLRDTVDLKMDRVGVDLHINGNPGGVAKKWYDNVVIATSYIGPLSASSGPTPPAPPTNIRIQ